jgi:hypothetical protein
MAGEQLWRRIDDGQSSPEKKKVGGGVLACEQGLHCLL